MGRPSDNDVERVAHALHRAEYPLGDWRHVRADHQKQWRAMARTICSVAMWGDYVNAAHRLAHWDDVDNKLPYQPFAEKTENAQRLWLRRAEVGFEALRNKEAPRVNLEPLDFSRVLDEDDGA